MEHSIRLYSLNLKKSLFDYNFLMVIQLLFDLDICIHNMFPTLFFCLLLASAELDLTTSLVLVGMALIT